MNDIEAAEDVGPQLSDAWLESLVRRLRGWPGGTPVPPALLASWRRYLRSEVNRVRSARQSGQDPYPEFYDRRLGQISADDLVLDLLRSAECRAFVDLAISWPRMLLALAEITRPARAIEAWDRAAARRAAEAAEGRALKGYIAAKFSGVPIGFRHGAPHALERAGANAVTPKRARAWLSALSDPWRVSRALAEARSVGRQASDDLAPLRIWDFEPGLPRGLVPDPSDLDDDPRADGDGTPPASGPLS